MGHPLTSKFLVFWLLPMILGFIYALREMSSRHPRERYWIVVAVKDCESWIEGYIRDFYRQRMPNSAELWLVDKGSQDETFAIAKRFTTYYPGMAVSDPSYGDPAKMRSQVILCLDGTELGYRNLLYFTRYLLKEKNIEIGLKSYKK